MTVPEQPRNDADTLSAIAWEYRQHRSQLVACFPESVNLAGVVYQLERMDEIVSRLVEAAEQAQRLLRDAECVIFEGVRENALAVTGCESWDEMMEDSDEVRAEILKFLGIKVVDRPSPRLARAEVAESRLRTAETALREIAATNARTLGASEKTALVRVRRIARETLKAMSS